MENYAINVFVNCPFDEDYLELFRSIVFVVHHCGFIPRSALELSDADDIRIEKIVRLIRESKYSIHDISRTEIDGKTNLPRVNMPFEFGIYIGAKRFGVNEQREKSCLVLDSDKYRYRNFISDISGQDIRSHANEPKQAITCVRNWLREKSGRRTIPGSHIIHEHYLKFRTDLPGECRLLKWDVSNLTFIEYSELVIEWLKENAG